jgi:hypothetical protein
VFGGHRVPHHHQAVDLGTVMVLELRQVVDVAPHDAHVGPEHVALDLVVVVQLLRIQHRLDHGLDISPVARRILSGVHRISTST